MSALYNHDIDLRLQDDLTGLVTKTGRYPIAFGGLSDVFIGELANSNPSLGVDIIFGFFVMSVLMFPDVTGAI
jgi:hypothetical protein